MTNIAVYVHHQENDIKFDCVVNKSKSALVVFLQGLLLEKAEIQTRRGCFPSSTISVYMDDFLDSSRTQRRRQPLHNRVCKTKSLPSRFKNYSDHDSSLVDNRWHNSSSSLDDCMICHRRLTQVRHSSTSIPSYRPDLTTSSNSVSEKNKYEVESRQIRTRSDFSEAKGSDTNSNAVKQHLLMQVEKRCAQRLRSSRKLNEDPTSPPQGLCSKHKETISSI